MKLSYHDFNILFGEAVSEGDRDRFVAEWSSSSIFYPTPEAPDIPADDLAGTLENVWDVAHLTPRKVREYLGLTQAKFAERYCIPYFTVKNWDAQHRKVPPYLVLALAKDAGMLRIELCDD